MFSPNHRSRFQRCPVCAKDVHKVLLQQHVEVCLERSAEGASAGAEDASAGDASAGGWGRPRDTANVGDATAGTATPFVTAGAFAESLRERTPFAALRESNDGRGPFRRDVRDATCDARVFGAERSSVGPLGGFLRSKTKRSEEREETSPFLGGARSPSREKAARTSERAESARRLFRPAESARPPSTDRTKPNEPLEPKEEETEGDVRGEGDADVERRRAESAVAVGDGGLLPFPVRVMSGDHRDCGICLQRFDARAGVERHVLWPCQHARQCGDCAIRIWQVPKSKRRCPWCKSKIDIRPRPFKPFL